MVSTHLKNISQIGSFPQVRVNIKNIWNHHLDVLSKCKCSRENHPSLMDCVGIFLGWCPKSVSQFTNPSPKTHQTEVNGTVQVRSHLWRSASSEFDQTQKPWGIRNRFFGKPVWYTFATHSGKVATYHFWFRIANPRKKLPYSQIWSVFSTPNSTPWTSKMKPNVMKVWLRWFSFANGWF